MLDFAAIDSTFLTRFLFGVAVYWLIGFFTKGIFEKIQSYYGSKFFGFTNAKLQEIKRYADQSCSEIDNILINPVAGVSDRLNRIINRDDLSPSDQQLHRQLINERYQLSILLKKLGVGEL